MARISKDPDVRKKELLDTAEELFEKKGYDRTSVSDIVKAVGVAQGTFYYYFKTKEELVDALTKRYAEMVTRKFEEIATNKNLSALEKLERIFRYFLEFGKERRKMVEFIHEDSNILLHQKLEDNSLITLTPHLKSIIEQGNEEGYFNVKYPREAVISIIAVNSYLLDQETLAAIYSGIFDDRYHGYIQTMERILGTDEGLISDLKLMQG